MSKPTIIRVSFKLNDKEMKLYNKIMRIYEVTGIGYSTWMKIAALEKIERDYGTNWWENDVACGSENNASSNCGINNNLIQSMAMIQNNNNNSSVTRFESLEDLMM